MRIRTTVLISLLVLLCIAVLTLNQRSAQAFDETTIYVNPATGTFYLGETFTVNVDIGNVTNLFSYEAKLGFNQTLIKPIGIAEGPFIRGQTASPSGTFFLPIIKDDYVHVACVTLGAYPGVNGSGNLFTVTFNTSAPGESSLSLYDSTLLDSTVAEITHSTIDGGVLVRVIGDVNGDGVVNIVDMTLVSLSYGTFEGEPGYNSEADLNDDGIVDMQDLTIVAMHLGEPTI